MGQYTQSYLASSAPSKRTDIELLSQSDADALTLDVFNELTYGEQVEFKRLFPDAYSRMIEQQEQEMGHTTAVYGMDAGHTGQGKQQSTMTTEQYEALVDAAIERVRTSR